MKRLFALCFFALAGPAGLAAADLPAEERPNVAVAAGFPNVVPEVVGAQLRQLRGGGTVRLIDGFAMEGGGRDGGAVKSDGAYALYPTGSAVSGAYSSSNAWRVWADGYVLSAVRSEADGYSNDAFGGMAGVDRAFGSLTVGASINYANGDFDARRGMDKTSYDGLNGMVYGRFACGNWSAELDFGYGRFWGDNRRRIPQDGTAARKDGMDLSAWFGAAQFAYRFYPAADWLVTPSAGVEYYYVKAESFRENPGNESALRYARHTHNFVRTPLMVTVERPVRTFGQLFTPFARLAFTPEWHGDRTRRDVSRAPDVHAKVEGPRPLRWTAMAGVGLNAKLGLHADLSASWDFEFGQKYRNNIWNFGLGFSF